MYLYQVLPGQVAYACLLQLSSCLVSHSSDSPRQGGCMQAADREHELSPELRPSPDWEGKPSKEPELCQGTCQERGGKDDCGPALSLCPGLTLFTGIDRAHSQRGQEESTALNVFSTLGTFALLALAMFSHAPLLCICSFPSLPCFPCLPCLHPTFSCMSESDGPAKSLQLYFIFTGSCNDSNNFLSFVLLYEG